MPHLRHPDAQARREPLDAAVDEPRSKDHVRVLPIVARWSVDLGGPPVARVAPVVDGDRVYVALGAGQIVARSLVDGEERWRKELTTDRPLATDAGVVFVVAGDAIHALQGTDGAPRWETPLPGISAPLVARSGWVIARAGSEVLAFRADEGTLVWRREIGASTEAPEIDGDRLYVPLDDGRVVAVALTTGAPVWESTLGGAAGALFVFEDRLYLGAGDRRFYCLKTSTGEIAWVWRVGAGVIGAAAADDSKVYFVALDNVLRGLDRQNGNQRWQHTYKRRVTRGPAVASEYVFLPSGSSPEIWMWTGKDGRSAGTLALPAEPAIPPAFLQRADGYDVVAVTGNLASQWQLTLLTTADEPPVSPLTSLPGLVLEPESLAPSK